jgi:hypothetical protein
LPHDLVNKNKGVEFNQRDAIKMIAVEADDVMPATSGHSELKAAWRDPQDPSEGRYHFDLLPLPRAQLAHVAPEPSIKRQFDMERPGQPVAR